MRNMNRWHNIYEDDQILVVRKPAGMAVQTANTRQKDMVSELRNYRAAKKEEPYIGVIHRLDQPVEGVMVFAKTKAAAANLSKQVAERNVDKAYRATVHGRVEPQQGELRDILIRNGKTNTSTSLLQIPEGTYDTPEMKQKIDIVLKTQKDAKDAYLEYQVISYDEERDQSTVVIQLHTGRHHQIRVQFSSRGWPLVGDSKYGNPAPNQRKLMLCSCKIAFRHPKSGEEMAFEI